MQKYDQNQYVDIFYRLPAEIKDMVAATATTEHLWKIGQKHDLHIDKVGIMTDIAFDVMMGIIASKNFVKELQESLQISALDAAVLARDIDENVFKPIKEIMIRTYGEAAPNKPGSSLVTITEDEEDHQNLDKDALLKEIESPSEAVVKVERSEEVVRREEVEKQGNQEMKMLESGEAVISEEAQKPKESEPKIETEKQSIEDIRTSFDRLADMKLSQATVMPRGSGEALKSQEAEKVEEKEIVPPASKTPDVRGAESKPTVTPTTPQAARPVDPYREAIN